MDQVELSNEPVGNHGYRNSAKDYLPVLRYSESVIAITASIASLISTYFVSCSDRTTYSWHTMYEVTNSIFFFPIIDCIYEGFLFRARNIPLLLSLGILLWSGRMSIWTEISRHKITIFLLLQTRGSVSVGIFLRVIRSLHHCVVRLVANLKFREVGLLN